MKTPENITVFGREYIRIETMEQLRHQGGAAGRGRRMGLAYYCLYQDPEHQASVLEQRMINQQTTREELETELSLGCLYLTRADFEMTLAAVKEVVR
jgi:hypothetical protein